MGVGRGNPPRFVLHFPLAPVQGQAENKTPPSKEFHLPSSRSNYHCPFGSGRYCEGAATAPEFELPAKVPPFTFPLKRLSCQCTRKLPLLSRPLYLFFFFFHFFVLLLHFLCETRLSGFSAIIIFSCYLQMFYFVNYVTELAMGISSPVLLFLLLIQE